MSDLITINIYVILIIMFVSSIFGAIVASIALMRYLHRVGALDMDAINKHRKEVSKRAGEKFQRHKKH